MRKVLGLVLLALFVAAGCSQTPTEQTTASQYDDGFGGVTTDNEAPGFGDETLLASSDLEVFVYDPVAEAIEAEAASDCNRHVLFALRVVWGQLCYDSTSVTPTNWDGSIMVDSGAVGVVREIRFEPEQDYLLERTAVNLVEWVSTTTVHNDGLMLLISANTALLEDDSENLVTFATGPLTISFTLGELVALDSVVSVDDAGNAVMFHGFHFREDFCPKGFLAGYWEVADETRSGEFRGLWLSRNGHLMGYLEGEFGVNDDSLPVFFGKYIDAAGNFEGRLRGVWGPADSPSRGGVFKGVFYDPMDEPAGRLHGHWNAVEGGTGTFQGVWLKYCPRWADDSPRWEAWDDEDFNPEELE